MAFTKYLNRPRLLYKFEADTVAVTFAAIIIPTLLGLFAAQPFIGILAGAILGYISLKNYPKYTKKMAPGLVQHTLYNIGLLNFNSKDKDGRTKNVIPDGYVNEFIE